MEKMNSFFGMSPELQFGLSSFLGSDTKSARILAKTSTLLKEITIFCEKRKRWATKNLALIQRYADRVFETIQMKLILLCVWAELAVLGSSKTALKFKYEIWIGYLTHIQLNVWGRYKLEKWKEKQWFNLLFKILLYPQWIVDAKYKVNF